MVRSDLGFFLPSLAGEVFWRKLPRISPGHGFQSGLMRVALICPVNSSTNHMGNPELGKHRHRLIAAMCYYIQAQYLQAIDEYKKALEMNPESTYSQAGLGMSLARSGNRGEALKALAGLQAMGGQMYVSPDYVGLVQQALGDTDAEFAWLQKGYDDQSEWLLWLPIDPMFDGQRRDPRLRELIRKVGVSQ